MFHYVYKYCIVVKLGFYVVNEHGISVSLPGTDKRGLTDVNSPEPP